MIILTISILSLTIELLQSNAQEPIQLGTKKEDIALTDDLSIAKAQVEKYPDNPEAHFNLAIALSRTSLVEEAIKELRKTKLLIRKTGNTETLDRKINEYKEMLKLKEGDKSFNNVRYRLAFSHYLKAYLFSKEYEKLKKQNNNKIKPDKGNSNSLNIFESKIISLEEDPMIKKNLDLSVYYFEELISIDPYDNWAKIYYAFILAEQMGQINKAKELWNQVLKENPNNPAPHFFIGELHIKEGNLKEGILEISNALLLRSLGH